MKENLQYTCTNVSGINPALDVLFSQKIMELQPWPYFIILFFNI